LYLLCGLVPVLVEVHYRFAMVSSSATPVLNVFLSLETFSGREAFSLSSVVFKPWLQCERKKNISTILY